MILPDYLRPGLRAIICGTAAGAVSARKGRYYAGPGNQFWPILYPAGIVPEPLSVGDEDRLLSFGIGLTDVAKHASGADHSIPQQAYDPARLRNRIDQLKPGALAFNGKNAAQQFLGRKVTSYGPQPEAFVPIWVLPSTSGAARGFWNANDWHAFGAFLTERA